ncbi:DUF2256 domain-containing protein [Vibrio navarrensis]|uniref:DUF2256 domain-containing protein n=1 Tax=Vibrio navarrensis TaxID=29495 RepID=UPI0018DD9FCF|nr:DUF2256 domain-containing protein [Vibrio navarrensis]
MTSHKKAYLAQKICPVCQRPFAWRKKWQQCWDEVKYCSERCRRHRSSQPLGAQLKVDANN